MNAVKSALKMGILPGGGSTMEPSRRVGSGAIELTMRVSVGGIGVSEVSIIGRGWAVGGSGLSVDMQTP